VTHQFPLSHLQKIVYHRVVHLQDVVKLHTFVLGHFGALLSACFGFDLRFALVVFD